MVVRVTHLGALSLFLDASGWKCMLGLIQLITEQSQMAMHNPDTQEVILEGRDSMVIWIKASLRSVYTEKGHYPIPPIKAKWNVPDEAADMLHMHAMWDWLYDDRDIHLLNMTLTQVIVNAVINGAPFKNLYCCKIKQHSRKPYRICCLSFPMDLTGSNTNIRLINKRM